MICNRCSKDNNPAARFCISCGTPLTSPAVEEAPYCGQCGREIAAGQPSCPACGVPDGQGTAFCRQCGYILTPGAACCPKCQAAVPQPQPAPAYAVPGKVPCQGQGAASGWPPPQASYGAPPAAGYTPQPHAMPKSKLAAGLLGIFLGAFGIHNFYLGYTNKAVLQLVVTLVGLLLSFLILPALAAVAMGIWGFVEGIMILAGNIAADGRGIALKD